MSDRTRDADKVSRPTTVLDPLRPAVVVRRRVYDATVLDQGAATPRAFTSVTNPPPAVEPDEDENGPPSSINVARALASLRADELQRVEDLVRADEEAERVRAVPPPPPPAPRAPAVPTVLIGKTIALSDLAERMGVPAQDLPATLVARGFYALNGKTVLPRETARVIAEMFGWHVEDAPAELDESAPVKSGTRSRIATKPKAGAKAKASGKAAKAKTARRRLAR